MIPIMPDRNSQSAGGIGIGKTCIPHSPGPASGPTPLTCTDKGAVASKMSNVNALVSKPPPRTLLPCVITSDNWLKAAGK